ncbi:MAG: NUDIX domain-containing protein [Actinobacteria bacterium]|nr:NUDIX domain-containing protein [Actinomycetota bacterium]
MTEAGPTTGAPILGVGAVVLRGGSLLMVQRAHDPGARLWSVPGGKVEPSEYLVQAVKREVWEETGLSIEVGDLLGIHEVIGAAVHYVVLDYTAEIAGAPTPRAAGDAADARWVPLDAIGTLDCTPRFRETLTGWGVLTSADEQGD